MCLPNIMCCPLTPEIMTYDLSPSSLGALPDTKWPVDVQTCWPAVCQDPDDKTHVRLIEGKMLMFDPSRRILSESHATDNQRDFKPVIGPSLRYGLCPPTSHTLPPYSPPLPCLVLHVGGKILQLVTKGCEWLWGAALRCPALTSYTSLLFNSFTSRLTWTDRLSNHPLSQPCFPPSSALQPQWLFSVVSLSLGRYRATHRMNPRRFRINLCLPLNKAASPSLIFYHCCAVFS